MRVVEMLLVAMVEVVVVVVVVNRLLVAQTGIATSRSKHRAPRPAAAAATLAAARCDATHQLHKRLQATVFQ
jgi:hypothetical protein